MAKYLIRANYTQAGVTGLLKEGGTGRRAALTQTIEGMGGTLEGFYYAFGDCDLYLIAELPDEATPMAVSMNIGRWRARCVDDRAGEPGNGRRGSQEERSVSSAWRLTSRVPMERENTGQEGKRTQSSRSRRPVPPSKARMSLAWA